MPLFAIAVPVLPGKLERLREFVAALDVGGRWRDEFVRSRTEAGVVERTFLQQTPMGDLVVVTLSGDEPGRAFASFGAGQDDFTEWFVAQVQEIHGIDLHQPPQGPPPELVVASD